MSWGHVRIKELILDDRGGASLKKDQFEDDGVAVIPKKAISECVDLLEKTFVFTSDEVFSANKTARVDSNFLITTLRNLNPDGSTLGLVCRHSYSDNVILAQGMYGFKVNEKIDADFLCYATRTPQFREQIQRIKVGSTQVHIRAKEFKELEIPLPYPDDPEKSLKEQKRIAAILDKADGIRRKRQQAIQLADDFLRSVFLDMFGDPVTNPKGWEVQKFGEVGVLDRGKSKHRPRNDPALLGGEHPLIQTGDVANSGGYIRKFKSTYSDFGLAQSRKWEVGTLCITIAANIAKTGVLTFEACFPDSVVGFKPNEKVTVEYIQYWLGFLQKTLEASAPESAQKNINLEILRNLDLSVPPINVQNEFSNIIKMAILNSEKKSKSEQGTSDFFNSLSQKAFKGEL